MVSSPSVPLDGQHWKSPEDVLGPGPGFLKGSSTLQSPPALPGLVKGGTGGATEG